MGIGQHEADRVVQFMRHAGHQTAEGGHLFGVQQLLLGALERFVGLVQLPVGVLQLAQRAADQHVAEAAPVGAAAHGATEVHRQRLAIGTAEVDLQAGAGAGLAQAGEQAAQALATAGVGEQGVYRTAAQALLVAADPLAQGVVGFLDQPLRIAGQENVGHRRQQPGNELLRLLQLGVLLFQGDLVLDQLRVDLVHLADDFQPGVFVQRRCGRFAGHRVSSWDAGAGGRGCAGPRRPPPGSG